jgi:dipeptidyl-peptidase 4
LGKYETEDQIHGMKYLAAQPYVNATQIGIWGWSYGGFMTLSVLTNPNEFHVAFGVSVAPVTDWYVY